MVKSSSGEGFLSTPSARRATFGNGAKMLVKTYFYPRPPRGGRQIATLTAENQSLFLSTPSARRATYCPECQKAAKIISIHALREEGDTLLSKILPRLSIFLSTPSARRATQLSIPAFPFTC